MKKTIFLLLLFILPGCEEKPDIENPIRYEKDGISFSYPGNWKVTEDEANYDIRYLFVESTGNALLTLQIIPTDMDFSLSEHAVNFSQSAADNIQTERIDEGQFTEIQSTENHSSWDGIKEEFSIYLPGQKVPHIRKYYHQVLDKSHVVMIYQASEEDFQTVEPGFDFILQSFESKP